ncbi:MAG TPA: adenosine deaminase [Chloroflexi bacterium]|nr:adenosine deaminase [Chloroflexota bacterium]
MNPFGNLPKAELHRHLEGSLRLRSLFEIARAEQLTLPAPTAEHFRALVQVRQHEPFTVENFLSKFRVLRLFYRSPEIIQRLTAEVVADAAADNIRYLELRFTPVALTRARGFSLYEVMDWVTASANEAARQHGIVLGLIVSVNRHEPPGLAEEVAELAVSFRSRGVVGLDLAGDESRYAAAPFAPIFREAKAAGLHITVHAGEWGPAANVTEAIENLHAERIGHGIRVLEDPNAIALARERGVVFEVCPTSNYQSGVVPALEAHPLPEMLAAGLRVTLNTDDPSISGIDLSHEFAVAHEILGLSPATLWECTATALESAFLSAPRRAALIRAFRKAWEAGGTHTP